MAENDELAPYVVEQVDGLKDCLKIDSEQAAGKGAYGAVYKVSVRGFPCIAKRLHEMLVSSHIPVEDKTEMQEKFRKECVMLSKLRHPNVVHFVGVHLGSDGNDVTLLMERLSSDLADFLTLHKDIPLSIKLSILLDVSYGLLYLHTCNPPIIHRDLTARNVLVTFDGQAKIADLGVAKFFDDERPRSHTQTPGQMYYMPPEAMKKDAECTQKIDIFSFGHLALYITIQEEPKIFDIECSNYTLVPQLNLQTFRREESLKRVGENHCMYSTMNRCLQDRADNRPTTEQLCLKMKELCVKCPKTPEDVHQLIQHKDDGYSSEELKRGLTIAKRETLAALGQRHVLEQGLKTAHEICNELQSELQETKRKCQEQKSSIATLVEKLSVSQSQAMSNKADFEEERKDREKAHNMLADLETRFEKEINDWKTRESSLFSQLEEAKQRNDQLTAQLSQATKAGESMRNKLRRLAEDEIVNKPTRWKRAFTSRTSAWHFKGKRDDLPSPMFHDSTLPDVCDGENASSHKGTTNSVRSESPISIHVPSGNRTCAYPVNALPLSTSAPISTCYSDLVLSKSSSSNSTSQEDAIATPLAKDSPTTNLDTSQPIPECEPDWLPRDYIEKVQARHDYIKKRDDELSFTSGTIIYVLKKSSDGWNEGVIAGVFPDNYAQTVN